jgi:hypothetical protein
MIVITCFKNVGHVSHVYLIPDYSRVGAGHVMKKITECNVTVKKKIAQQPNIIGSRKKGEL